MKLRHFITSLAVTAVAALGAFAGLSQRKEAQEVKADGEKWMMTVAFDNTNPETSQEWGFVDDYWVHFWGTNLDYNVNVVEMHPTGVNHFYAVNAVFESNQVVSGMQIVFHENSVEKQSQDITGTWNSTNNGQVYYYEFPETPDWTGGKWSVTPHSSDEPIGSFNSVQMDFVANPAKARYEVTNVALEAGQYVSLVPFSYAMHVWKDTVDVLRTADKDSYVATEGSTWFSIKSSGTYDFFITNEFSDGGIVSIKKHCDEYVGIYLVNVDEDVYVYTFGEGGIEEFGAYGDNDAGTRLGDISGAQNVKGNLKFQGNDWDIWYLPLHYGYPEADHIILSYKNEFNIVANKSADMLIVEGSAYWFSYDDNYHNDNAGAAIRFLLDVEEAIADASGSVCSVSDVESAGFVNRYKALADADIYVDATKVTHKNHAGEGTALYSYRDVVKELGRNASLDPFGMSQPFANAIVSDKTTLLIIIAVSIIGVSCLTAFVIIKKRKHQ